MQQPINEVSKLFNTLATENDKIWPYKNWPAIHFQDGLHVGSRGGHGIVRYTIIEYIKGEEKNSYKHSNHAQPLHTDYGYFSFEIFCSFFYCEAQAEFGGATTFIDVNTVVELLQKIDTNLLEELKTTLIHFGRKDNPIAHNDDYILQEDDLGWKINWNYYRALGDKENSELIEKFIQIIIIGTNCSFFYHL